VDGPVKLSVDPLGDETEQGASPPDRHDDSTNDDASDDRSAAPPPLAGGNSIGEDFLEWALTYVGKKLH
jgi:hypothetical protein